jgi:hypothetical protein
VQTVLGLIEYHALGAINDLGRYLLPPMRWQAVHDDAGGVGDIQEPLVDLIF